MRNVVTDVSCDGVTSTAYNAFPGSYAFVPAPPGAPSLDAPDVPADAPSPPVDAPDAATLDAPDASVDVPSPIDAPTTEWTFVFSSSAAVSGPGLLRI